MGVCGKCGMDATRADLQSGDHDCIEILKEKLRYSQAQVAQLKSRLELPYNQQQQ
jgi:hypothetical protein